jgi:hypothetical protein
MNDFNQKVKKIVAELIDYDSNLKDHKEILEKLVIEMFKNKPRIKIDQNFKTSVLKNFTQEKTKNYFWNYVATYFSGALSFALIFLVFVSFTPFVDIKYPPKKLNSDKINTFSKQAEKRELQEDSNLNQKILGRGGAKEMQEVDNVSNKKNNLNLDLTKFNNLKKYIIKPNQEFKDNVYNFSFLKNLDNLQNKALTLVEKKEKNAYEINVRDGFLSIYRNLDTWKKPEYQDCKTSDCHQKYKLTKKDLPEDKKLIKITNDFLANYSFDLKNYGNPQVLNYQKTHISPGRNPEFIPETIQVLYPLIIDNKEVYEINSQTQSGFRVGVNIRDFKVSNLYNLIISQEIKTEPVNLIKDLDQINNYLNNQKEDFNNKKIDSLKEEDLEINFNNQREVLVLINNFSQEKTMVPALKVWGENKTDFKIVPLNKDFYSK